jgi:oligoribonuclease (3'-5' exoribonuclease)
VQDAERQVLAFVQRYTDDTTRHHLAGLNSAAWYRDPGLIVCCPMHSLHLLEAAALTARQQRATTGWHAGSSVHVDLAFLRKDMPQLAAHLPYRVVVSVCWYP